MLYSILRQDNTYVMTGEDGTALCRLTYSRRAKSRRGVCTVAMPDGSRTVSMTERLFDLAVYRGEALLYHVCEQPDIRVRIGARLAHCQIPELQLFCDGSRREGYTLYSAQGGTGSITVGELDGQLFLSIETDIEEPLALLALAFYLVRKF